MMKWLLAWIMIVVGCPTFSEEFQHELQDWQTKTLTHLGYGNAYLLSNEPWLALEQLQKARSCIDRSDNSSSPIDFLIIFSQLVAYDCLGFQDACKQSIGSLFLSISEYNENDDPSIEDPSVFKQDESASEAVQFLQELASIAPSYEVRELLFSLIDDIAEELLPPFKFATAPLVGDLGFEFGHTSNRFSIDLCKHKSFWKRFTKWCHEIRDWLEDLSKILKSANDVREAYKKWERENNQHHLTYDEFKYYYRNHKFNN